MKFLCICIFLGASNSALSENLCGFRKAYSFPSNKIPTFWAKAARNQFLNGTVDLTIFLSVCFAGMAKLTDEELYPTLDEEEFFRKKAEDMAHFAKDYEEKMKKGNFSDYFNSPDSLLLAGVPLCKVWEDQAGQFLGKFSHGKVLMDAFQFGN